MLTANCVKGSLLLFIVGLFCQVARFGFNGTFITIRQHCVLYRRCKTAGFFLAPDLYRT